MNARASSVKPSRSSAYRAEARVAHPDVAVVPVTLAANVFGQAGGGGGDHRADWLECVSSFRVMADRCTVSRHRPT